MNAELQNEIVFQQAVNGLLTGELSRLAPLFEGGAKGNGRCQIIDWHEQWRFVNEPHLQYVRKAKRAS